MNIWFAHAAGVGVQASCLKYSQVAKEKGVTLEDGFYRILQNNDRIAQLWCDMKNGGWTLVGRQMHETCGRSRGGWWCAGGARVLLGCWGAEVWCVLFPYVEAPLVVVIRFDFRDSDSMQVTKPLDQTSACIPDTTFSSPGPTQT